MPIYTLGTSNRPLSEFTKILNKYRIDIIFDVRRFPTSYFEHFKRENLARLCQSIKVEYVYFGQELGGFRKGGYKEYTKTEGFARAVNIIKERAKGKVVLILCRERFPWKCHRRFIGEELEKNNVAVTHIIDTDKTWRRQ